MFVFGQDDRPRRLGAAGVLALVLLAVGVAAAVRWHPQPPRAAPVAAPDPSSHPEALGCRSLLSGLMSFQGGRPDDLTPYNQASLRSEAARCTPEVAADPGRIRLSDPLARNGRIQRIDAAVNQALCPGASCQNAVSTGEADVPVVRQALNDLGHADAVVRLAGGDDDGVPFNTVVYGLPMGDDVCLVAYVRMGLGVVPLGPVGAYRDGTCLR